MPFQPDDAALGDPVQKLGKVIARDAIRSVASRQLAPAILDHQPLQGIDEGVLALEAGIK